MISSVQIKLNQMFYLLTLSLQIESSTQLNTTIVWWSNAYILRPSSQTIYKLHTISVAGGRFIQPEV